MYSFVWDPTTHGYLLTSERGKFVANEIRPVFVEELRLTGMYDHFKLPKDIDGPVLWAQKNTYLFDGEKVAQLNRTQYGRPLDVQYFFEGKLSLKKINITRMVEKNRAQMNLIVADAIRRTKELYNQGVKKTDVAYIAFSGGKDSVVVLDICHQILPLSSPVIYSDTDMELASSQKVWDDVQKRYPDREFIKVKAEESALRNWELFGPPSRSVRWCCSVHKSTPVIIYLKNKYQKDNIRTLAFLGIRGSESLSRSNYEDFSVGVKNASQINCMPILDWDAHELWLYIFAHDLEINSAYKSGLQRVGCTLCPESSERYTWFVDKIFPNTVSSYVETIINTSNKQFKSAKEKTEYIGSSNWQARKSGVVLQNKISFPVEQSSGQTTTFRGALNPKLLFEWIKTLGTFKSEDLDVTSQKFCLKPPRSDERINVICDFDIRGFIEELSFQFNTQPEQLRLLPLIRSCIRKVVACVGCRCCETECHFGAITFHNHLPQINEFKCVQCQKCYDIDYSCWRYRSMRDSEQTKNTSGSINSYKNFGLRENETYGCWISLLMERGNQFFPWNAEHPLGNKMVESARNWFLQAELIDKDRTCTELVNIFKKQGSYSTLGWEFIWVGLTNNAPLIKWFATDLEFDKEYSSQDLIDRISLYDTTLKSTSIDGGLAALKDMLTKSPLGVISPNKILKSAIASVEVKGKAVQKIKRLRKDVNPLTLLYHLYFIARITERSVFTIRDMISTEKNGDFVTPASAFGLSAETIRQYCESLQSRLPGYISTTFTHGNDEFEIFPSKHNLNDIINLALTEN